MDVLEYLYQNQNVSLKEKPFNELDALLLSCVAYFPFDQFPINKNIYRGNALYETIKNYQFPPEYGERRIKYFKVAQTLCLAKRFNKIQFGFFKKERDENSDKQFQAITIILKDFIFISFCGTDATVLGWKEDFNMAYLDMVPSEIAAIKYANDIRRKFPFKKIYIGGHSKGGRLAITAAKELSKTKRLMHVFSFDAPNFPAHCYDDNYKKVDELISYYAPEESIIGRLMNEYRPKIIVKSSNSLLMQHDTFSWLVEDCYFIKTNAYTEKSTRIVRTINNTLTNNDEETKQQFIETLFDIIERLNIEELPNEKVLMPFFISQIPHIWKEWRSIDKDNRSVVKKIVIELLKDYFFGK